MNYNLERALRVREHENNVLDHWHCVKRIFSLYNTQEKLEELQKRPDLDTVCAAEHFRLKKFANEGGLNYENYFPEHFRGVKIPEQ